MGVGVFSTCICIAGVSLCSQYACNLVTYELWKCMTQHVIGSESMCIHVELHTCITVATVSYIHTCFHYNLIGESVDAPSQVIVTIYG